MFSYLTLHASVRSIFSLITLITVQKKGRTCDGMWKSAAIGHMKVLRSWVSHHLTASLFVLDLCFESFQKCIPLRIFLFTWIYFILVSFIQLVFDARCNSSSNFGEREHSQLSQFGNFKKANFPLHSNFHSLRQLLLIRCVVYLKSLYHECWSEMQFFSYSKLHKSTSPRILSHCNQTKLSKYKKLP